MESARKVRFCSKMAKNNKDLTQSTKNLTHS